MKTAKGMVYLVGGGPGDPGLITLRGVECLRQAEVIIYDRLVPASLLDYAPAAEKIAVGKRPKHHPVPQDEINGLLLQKAREGKVVVRLKGGDPFLFGRGGEEALVLHEAGIPFEIVPGISSGLAVPAYAGIPVTQRGAAASVVFLTAHKAEGCPPAGLCIPPGADTYVFFMGVERLPQIVAALQAQGKSTATPVAVVARGTTSRQVTVTGSLEDIVFRAASIQPPAIIVVGEVVRLHDSLNWFAGPQRPLLGLRVLNTRPLRRGLLRLPEAPDPFQGELLRAGAEAVAFPSAQITPVAGPAALDEALARLEDYSDLVFTSANAVDYFCDRLLEGGGDLRRLSGLRISVVGKATAESLAKFYLKPDFVPSQAYGKSLAEELPDVAGRRVLLPCSSEALEDLPQILGERGARVRPLTTYEVHTGPPPSPSLSVVLAEGLDALTFFSPSAAQGLAHALAESVPEAEVLRALPAFCIGETTAQAARNAGFAVTGVAGVPSGAGVVRALIDWREGN